MQQYIGTKIIQAEPCANNENEDGSQSVKVSCADNDASSNAIFINLSIKN